MGRKYIIYDSSKVDSVNFDEVLETSKTTLRYNNDRTKVILKYQGNQPSFLSGETEYTYDELVAIIDDPTNGWCDEEE